MAQFAEDATGVHRALTLARYAILVEAGIQPSLRAHLLATGARVNVWFTNWLKIAGCPDPERHAPILMNHWSGVVLHQLAIPDPAFDPYPQIATLVSALIPVEVRPRAPPQRPRSTRTASGRRSTPTGSASPTCSTSFPTPSGSTRRCAPAGPCATSPPT